MKTPSVSYRNYFKPTPTNIQYLSETIEGLCITLATVSYFQSHPGWTIALCAGGYLFGKASKFFGRVAEDQKNEATNA